MKKIKKFLLSFAIFNILLFLGFCELNINYQFLEKEFYPNSFATLILTLQNSAKFEIKSLSIIFEAEDKNIEIIPFKLELEKLSPSFQFSQNFLIKIGENAKTSNIRIYVSYYLDSERRSFFLNIPIKIIRFPILLIKNINYSQDFLEPGKNITITLEVYNSGYSSAKDIKIKLLSSSLITFQTDEIFIKEIRVGESTKVSFLVFSNPEMSIGYYNIQLAFSFFNEDYSKVFNEMKSFSIKIFGKPQLDVITESFLDNLLTLKIINKGTSKAKNILVKFDEKEFFIEELNVGEYETIDVEKRNLITINLTYLDSLNNKHEETKKIHLSNVVSNVSNITIPRRFPSTIQRQTQQNNLIQILTIILFIIAVGFLLFFIFKKVKRKKK